MEQTIKNKFSPFFFLKVFLFSYALTAVFLLFLALLMYKLRIGETIVNVGIILIYIITCFLAGFITGKRMGNRKFIWGLVVGIGYFVILAVMSVLMAQGVSKLGGNFASTMFLCAGSGMLGGMLS